MNDSKPPYWFPAKTYGWGWGFPATWQGWLVFLLYLVSMGVGLWLVDPAQHPFGFMGLCVTLSALFLAVCWAKGEPPRWRWGK